MNNRKSTDSFFKRLIPTAESTTKSDDGKRNQPSAYHQNLKNTSDPVDRQKSSYLSLSNISSPGRGAIDAQTYVDAQSNGLTQRIVRYDEENKKTPSVYNRAYKRAGDFPIVHLDKPKLILTPKRNIANPPKIAKIGQPDPCINRTNIRAEILRNGTMMPAVSLDRREDVDNVRVDPLDALKEISRKRIHCEEDTINTIQPTIEKDSTDSNPNPTSKRQRIAPVNPSSSNETNKRVNSKCNEILSSLSSSSYMLSDSLKRAKVTSPNNSISPPQAKRLQTEKPIEAPIVDSAAIVSVPKPAEKIVPAVAEKTYPTEPARPKLTLFNRPYSANTATLQRANTSRGDECTLSFVKPRPMTARSRESVENWLKVKPDEKRRLSLMLKCLSGEVDDDSDAVDSGEKVNENPKPANPITEDSSTKPLSEDKNAPQKSTIATVAPTTQVDSITTATLLPTKPTVPFNPVFTTIAPILTPATAVQPSATLVQPSATLVQPPSTIVQPPATLVQPPAPIVQVATTIEERKGGFSFPLATKETTTTAAAPIPVASSVSSFSSPLSAIATSSVVASSPSIISNDPPPTLNPSVSFTFHPSKPKVTPSSHVATAVEPTKAFTFGTASNTNNTPVFGTSAPPAETTKQTTSSTLEEPKKTSSFAAFGQTTSIAGNINFGKNLTTSTAAPNTFAFGSAASSKAQPPTFGSIQTTAQQPTIQSNETLTFSANEHTSAFGSTTTSNAQKPVDSRISNIATTSAPNQTISFTSAIGSGSFVVSGATTNPSAANKNAPPTLLTSFSSKSTNSTPNIFGSSASQHQQKSSTSIFGTPATTTTSMFGQTPAVDSMKSTEPERNVAAPNIFGSSSASKPPSASTFAFSANSQANTNNIFGSQALANSGTGNAFTFGGSIQKSDSSSGKPFSFSNNNIETKPVAFGATKSAAPTFGSANVIDSTKPVGFPAANQASSTNLFTNTSTNEVPKPFSFGATNNPSTTNAAPSFGGTSSTFGTSSAFGAAPPSFGSAKATPSFAASGTPAFGSVSSTPSFKSANATPAFGSASTTPSFATANTTPAFGSASSTPSFATANATPTFGSSNVTPSFTSANAASPFGSTPPFTNANAAPSFGSPNATPSFASPLAFGGSNAMPNFGGSGFTANSGAPSFGSNSNNSNNSVFGGSSGTPPAFSTSTGTADANRTFNFTGSDPAPSPVPNLFNIGPGNPAPRGRTIRTATRRAYR